MVQVNALTEREFALWQTRGPLWPRRMELMFMQLTNILARVNGEKTKMMDFDLFNLDPDAGLHEAAFELGAIAGAGVHMLGQGREQ